MIATKKAPRLLAASSACEMLSYIAMKHDIEVGDSPRSVLNYYKDMPGVFNMALRETRRARLPKVRSVLTAFWSDSEQVEFTRSGVEFGSCEEITHD